MTRVDGTAVDALVARARRDVDDGLLPACQLAVAVDGELVVDVAFGDATPDTRFTVFSCTKPFVSLAVLQLVADGRLDPASKVVDVLPEFGENGKDTVTVEQVLLHTGGFPQAPMSWERAADPDRRVATIASWRLNWEPGTRYEYHPSAAHWVLATIIERVTGDDYRDVIERRVTAPAGLPRVLGIPEDAQDGIAALIPVGEAATAEELEAVLGIPGLDLGEVTADNLLRFNEPAVRAIGHPGGGGIMTAAQLASFYQAILRDDGRLLDPAWLHDATGHVRNRLPDPMLGHPANRTLAFQVAGDDGHANKRGFGATCSPGAFGHGGAYGQVGWADPATGMSFAYCTNGMDLNQLREARRAVGLSSRAAVCAVAG